MHVSLLDPSHIAAYRVLMLEAYEKAPDAFTTTAAERESEPDSWWVKRIGSASGSATSFGAWQRKHLIGTVALEYATKPKTRHSALILGMYVRPEVVVLTLTLTEGNAPALRLYQSVGFEVWGTQPIAIRTESGLRGKVHMSLKLQPPTAAA